MFNESIKFDTLYEFKPCKPGLKRAKELGFEKGKDHELNLEYVLDHGTRMDAIWFAHCLPNSTEKLLFLAEVVSRATKEGLIAENKIAQRIRQYVVTGDSIYLTEVDPSLVVDDLDKLSEGSQVYLVNVLTQTLRGELNLIEEAKRYFKDY